MAKRLTKTRITGIFNKAQLRAILSSLKAVNSAGKEAPAVPYVQAFTANEADLVKLIVTHGNKLLAAADLHDINANGIFPLEKVNYLVGLKSVMSGDVPDWPTYTATPEADAEGAQQKKTRTRTPTATPAEATAPEELTKDSKSAPLDTGDLEAILVKVVRESLSAIAEGMKNNELRIKRLEAKAKKDTTTLEMEVSALRGEVAQIEAGILLVIDALEVFGEDEALTDLKKITPITKVFGG